MNLMSQYALSFLHTPYIWGGKTAPGLDCSGLVCEVLRAFGFIGKSDLSAQELFNLPEVQRGTPTLEEGSLLFFDERMGGKHITHVAYALNDKVMIEAGSGDKTCLTPADAQRKNAYSRIRPIRHRLDLYKFFKPIYLGV